MTDDPYCAHAGCAFFVDLHTTSFGHESLCTREASIMLLTPRLPMVVRHDTQCPYEDGGIRREQEPAPRRDVL